MYRSYNHMVYTPALRGGGFCTQRGGVGRHESPKLKGLSLENKVSQHRNLHHLFAKPLGTQVCLHLEGDLGSLHREWMEAKS